MNLYNGINNFRNKRFDLFIKLFNVKYGDKILDVGGYSYTWEGSGLEKNVTLLNLDKPRIVSPFKYIIGDARDMTMFDDKYFDIIFSNSVIEHVGNYEEQKKMSQEIRRVAKKYWVQTPYKHFPIEIHFLFPYFQYLPLSLKLIIAKTWPFSFSKKLGLDPKTTVENIWLLNIREFKSLFYDAEIEKEKFLGLYKSLIAIKI